MKKIMKKILFLITLLIFLLDLSYAAEISGKILIKGNITEGCIIGVLEDGIEKYETTSNESGYVLNLDDGNYSLIVLCTIEDKDNGTYKIYIQSRNISIKANKSTILDFSMSEPYISYLNEVPDINYSMLFEIENESVINKSVKATNITTATSQILQIMMI